MGLHVHSLENIPNTKNRDYFIYLLDFGWYEPLSEALNRNFDEMVKKAAVNRAVVIKGTELAHFENEVFSYHSINNEKGTEILPAILITNTHPSYFLENKGNYIKSKGLYRETVKDDMKLILIPLKRFCKSTIEVSSLIEKLFLDIEEGLELSNFKIAKEIKREKGLNFIDSLILEPNVIGVGINFNKIIDYFNKKN